MRQAYDYWQDQPGSESSTTPARDSPSSGSTHGRSSSSRTRRGEVASQATHDTYALTEQQTEHAGGRSNDIELYRGRARHARRPSTARALLSYKGRWPFFTTPQPFQSTASISTRRSRGSDGTGARACTRQPRTQKTSRGAASHPPKGGRSRSACRVMKLPHSGYEIQPIGTTTRRAKSSRGGMK